MKKAPGFFGLFFIFLFVSFLLPQEDVITAAKEKRFDDVKKILLENKSLINSKDSRDCTGNYFIDVDLLRETGVTNFKPYQNNPEIGENQLLPDLFL